MDLLEINHLYKSYDSKNVLCEILYNIFERKAILKMWTSIHIAIDLV